MPVEVRELIIRTVVNASDEKTTSTAPGGQQASKKNTAAALEKLMELIRNKNER